MLFLKNVFVKLGGDHNNIGSYFPPDIFQNVFFHVPQVYNNTEVSKL